MTPQQPPKPLVVELPARLKTALTKRAQAMEMKRNVLVILLLEEAMAEWMRENKWR